jgi:hypothetical protein
MGTALTLALSRRERGQTHKALALSRRERGQRDKPTWTLRPLLGSFPLLITGAEDVF